MIAHLTGTVAAVAADRAVLDVGGVGMGVLASPRTLASLRVGHRASLHTCLVVREDALTLYGFADARERDAFTALQGVTGVGPRLALGLLAVHTSDALAAAVADGDTAALTRVPGVGAKLAARLVLELGGVLVAGGPAAAAAADGREQVVEALVGLGWAPRAARTAVEGAVPEAIPAEEVPTALKAALQSLAGSRG
jgi:Holliday junction DNA helicase RuvA